jgi:hypothetical protein
MATVYPEGTKATARRFYREGLSVRQIAANLGVGKSAVAGWVRGLDRGPLVKTCWCGEKFTTTRAHALSCSPEHASKRARLFGPVQPHPPRQ